MSAAPFHPRCFYVLTALTALMLQGCAVVFSSRRVALVCQQDSTSVTLLNNELSEWGATLSYSTSLNQSANSGYVLKTPVLMRGKIGDVQLKNNKDYYIVTQTRKGYIPVSSLITRHGFNVGKGIDLFLPIAADILWASGALYSNDPNNPGSITVSPAIYPTVYFGTVGWIDLLFGPWTQYSRRYVLPPIMPIPYRDTNMGKTYIKEVSVTINKDSLQRKYYETYNKYENKTLLYSSSEKGVFKVENTTFKDTLNRLLKTWKYIDTGKALLSFMYRAPYYLKCDIYGMTVTTVNALSFLTLKTTWKLYGATSDKEVFHAKFVTSSDWGTFNEDDEGFTDYISNALEKSMAQFMQDSEIQNILHTKSAKMSVTDGWKTIELNMEQTDTISNLQDAVKAVVTVKVPDGHGSGCIISSDGYLVTNYHVIADDTSEQIEVITGAGDTLIADYIRSNSVYDLALFKIRKQMNFKFFVPSNEQKLMLGTEVYAIGTPLDMSLGQTITKGIISGKRKANNKDIIQTDVSINAGNSGGALVDNKGALLGIVNAKLTGENVQGIGFAIPASYITEALKVTYSPTHH